VIENFKLYSSYYDLLYDDKDYKSESAYVDQHIRNLLPEAREILELGSGTGNHAAFLSGFGYVITGIERSTEMLAIANAKHIAGFDAHNADITTFRLDKKYDAAISLFHSFCYITSNQDLITAFRNISQHLKPGGVLAFDFWYAPAVLHHLPVSKTKIRQNDLLEITRRGETTMFIDKNIAEVNYEIGVRDKRTSSYRVITEKHPMRYFSIPEIDLLARQAGFEMVEFEEFLTNQPPTLESWSIFVVLKKTGSF
jgi:SAM-dependent methyltransferase